MNAKATKVGRVDADGVVVGPVIRTRYNYDMDAASQASGISFDEPTLAQQQFKEECDINTIVERFGVTGQLPQNVRPVLQHEFLETMTYQEALNKLIEADESFMKLPANIREQFQNDAGKFVDFVTDPKNVEKSREWGMVMPEPKEREPMTVRVVPEPEKTFSAPMSGTGGSSA